MSKEQLDIPRHWRGQSFRYDPFRYLKNLTEHNPYVGLAHATSSAEVREKVHDNRLEMGKELSVEQIMEEASV